MSKTNNLTPILVLGGIGLALVGLSNESVRNVVTSLIPGATPVQFTKILYPFALASERSTGVPALVSLAQGGIESGFGASAPGNNYFGIKAGSSWSGKTQKLKTWECGKTGVASKDDITDEIIAIYPPGDSRGICGPDEINDLQLYSIFKNKYLPADQLQGSNYSYRVYSKFRAYSSPADSFKDHGLFLKNNSRYAKAFKYKDPKLFAAEVAKAGYATAPSYGAALNKQIDLMKGILGI